MAIFFGGGRGGGEGNLYVRSVKVKYHCDALDLTKLNMLFSVLFSYIFS
jgi:hypothetical protein